MQTYTYDTRNRLTGITLGTNVYSFNYDAASRRIQLTFPGDDYGTYGYDNADRLTNLTWYKPGSPTPTILNQNSYTFDNADRITNYSEAHSLVSGATTFGYDNVNRLSSTTPTGGFGYAPHAYTYDAAGNRVSVTLGGSPVNYALKSGGLNQYATAGSSIFTYDANGNMTGDGTRTMAYDTDNNLTQATVGTTSANYVYDSMHRVAKRTQTGPSSSSVRYIYDEAWNVLCDVDANTGNVIRLYIRGPWTDETLGQMPTGSSETPVYLCSNHLGSTTALINAWTNDVLQHFSYDEYGTVQVRTAAGYPDTAPPATRYLFTGREYDQVTGFNNHRHRYYSSQYGRWVSRDPAPEAELEEGPNLYAYVGGEPVGWIDLDGFEKKKPDSNPPSQRAHGADKNRPKKPPKPKPAPSAPDPLQGLDPQGNRPHEVTPPKDYCPAPVSRAYDWVTQNPGKCVADGVIALGVGLGIGLSGGAAAPFVLPVLAF